MILSVTTMRILLVLSLLGMALLALLFLRRRQLSRGAYLAWGIVVILLPALGPFLVLITKPGTSQEKGVHLH